jgi:hypothetical protein
MILRDQHKISKIFIIKPGSGAVKSGGYPSGNQA